MKIAITATSNSLESLIDRRFGRCSFFVIYDTMSGSVEYIPNPNKGKLEGAGPACVQLLTMKGVEKVISGEFGAKVKVLFDSRRIQLILLSGTDKKVREIIALLKQKN